MGAIEVLTRRREALVGDLDALLRATAFDNSYMFHPRRLAEVGAEQVDLLLRSLAAPDAAVVAAFGGKLAREGFGEKNILKLAARLRVACRRELSAAAEVTPVAARETLDTVEGFTTTLLEGYVGAWKAELLEDQERIRKAVADASGAPREK